MAAAVPLQDQILLLGPPYKVPKDSSFQSEEVLASLRLGDSEDNPLTKDGTPGASEFNESPTLLANTTERSGARRLFLFSKQALSQNAPDPAPCHLEPMNIHLPQEAPGPSPLNITQQTQQPLHQALAAYERQFMLYLAQGKVLADGADLRLATMRQCVQEQAVMCRALRAAVSNLSDHFSAAARTRAEFSVAFTAKTTAHGNLLQRFDSILANDLANTALHPSLVAVARASGRSMTTLLDTVPVERERAWAHQCQTAHQRLSNLFRELEVAFGELGTSADRQEEATLDQVAEQEIDSMWAEVEGKANMICILQGQRLDQLTEGHRNVVKVISNALNSDPNELQNAFSPLQEMSSSSKDLVPSMIEDDNKLKSLMERVGNAKTSAMKRMKVRLRVVSVKQSSIQRVLASVSVLRDALMQQTENMVHLEHVAELVNSYCQFLSELKRRRAYSHAVSSSTISMMERLAAMRADEVRAREKFLHGPGRHLMPAFFDTFAPTLQTPPPLFTPQLPGMVEMDTLPDVSDVETSNEVAGSISEMQHNIASSLTVSATESQGHRVPSNDQATSAEKQHQQDQLIVSAEDASEADLILDPGDDTAATAAANAQMKTLAYENAVLRQALERMGGKPPRTYLEEKRMNDSQGGAIVAEEFSALRSELAKAHLAERAAKDALQASKEISDQFSAPVGLSDKISHSSFEVGDVGLFMPTGRGSGGKRTYLAFHTNCPHRYLSTDCVKGTPDFVLGRIVFQEQLVAGEIGTDANPYGLHVGTTFFVLTVEVLNREPPK